MCHGFTMNKVEILAGIRTHAIWRGMISRCSLPKAAGYKHYGGRGICFCERWKVFENFLDDMGLPKDGESLDRIDPNGNYEPGNCRWADNFVQSNNRRNNRRVTFNGETLTLAEWARKLNIPRNTIVRRYNKGRPPHEILHKGELPGDIETARRAMVAIRRTRTHCAKGHELTPDNTYAKAAGYKGCKTCIRANKRAFNAKARLSRHAIGLKNKGRWAHLPPP